MIEEFDLDQDGEINEHEFFAIMADEAWVQQPQSLYLSISLQYLAF